MTPEQKEFEKKKLAAIIDSKLVFFGHIKYPPKK